MTSAATTNRTATPLARLLTVAGTIAVLALVHAIAPNVPGVSSVGISGYSLGNWISVILVPIMAIVSLGFLMPARDLMFTLVHQHIEDAEIRQKLEGRIASAAYSLAFIFALMIFYYFARQSFSNPILSSYEGLKPITEVVVAVLGIVALAFLTISLVKIVPVACEALARSISSSS